VVASVVLTLSAYEWHKKTAVELKIRNGWGFPTEIVIPAT
jgi:hypothetical protein